MAEDTISDTAEDDAQSDDGTDNFDPQSTLRRRGLLASAGTATALATTGCLGLLSGRDETGPRNDRITLTGDGQTTTTTDDPNQTVQQFDIEFLNQDATIGVGSDEALLYAGLDEGWDLPYQCERGICGVCTAKVDGDGTELVRHEGNEYLDEEQIEAGFVLTCVGHPEADFSIETGMQEEADSFTGGEQTPEETTTAPADVETYDIEYVEQGGTIEVASTETLLDAGLDEDWDVPYQCGHGICGECTSKVDGDGTELVRHEGNQYLDEEQIEAGYVLTCVGHPEADFSLTTGKKEEADEI